MRAVTSVLLLAVLMTATVQGSSSKTLPYALFNTTCQSDFMKQVTPHLVKTNIFQAYKNLVVNVCFRYVMNVENLIKPNTCVYSGFYAMRYIKLAVDANKPLQPYAASFCKSLPLVLY